MVNGQILGTHTLLQVHSNRQYRQPLDGDKEHMGMNTWNMKNTWKMKNTWSGDNFAPL